MNGVICQVSMFPSLWSLNCLKKFIFCILGWPQQKILSQLKQYIYIYIYAFEMSRYVLYENDTVYYAYYAISFRDIRVLGRRIL